MPMPQDVIAKDLEYSSILLAKDVKSGPIQNHPVYSLYAWLQMKYT